MDRKRLRPPPLLQDGFLGAPLRAAIFSGRDTSLKGVSAVLQVEVSCPEEVERLCGDVRLWGRRYDVTIKVTMANQVICVPLISLFRSV